MAALAGLRALGHLDLDLLGAVQVGGGHAEPGGGHLLDGAVFLGAVARRIFAALAGIGFAPQGVHGDGHGGVGLLGDGAIGHCPALEPLDDLTGRLHLLQGEALLREVEFHQPPQGVGLALVVHQVGILPEAAVVPILHRLPQGNDGLGIVHVILGGAAGAELVDAGGIQGGVHPQIQQVKGVVVPPLDALADLLQADALHGADGVGEILIDNVAANAHRLKNLSGLVGLQRGNAHLGGDLHDAVEHGGIIVRNGLMGILVQAVFLHLLGNALLGKIGIDGPRAVAQQGGKVVHIPRLRALQNDGDGGALLGADQVLFQCGHRQQGRDGHMVFIHPPVGQDQDIGARPVGPVALQEELIQRRFQRGILVVQQRHRLHPEAGAVHGPDLHQLHGGEDGIADLQHPAVFRLLLEQVAVGADVHRGIGDDLLPQCIDGRIGHLGKELLEIVEQRLVLFRQHRQRNVRAHGGDLLRTGAGHGQNGIVDILVGVAEGLIQLLPLLLGIDGYLFVGHAQLLQANQVGIQPLAVGLAGSEGGLAFLIGDHPFLHRIHQQHLAGLEPGLAQNVLRRNIQHAHLAGQHQTPVLGDVVPGGAQTIAVQHRAHHVAVGEEDGGGAVPGLHHGGVVVIQIPLLPGHAGIIPPGLRDGDHHGQGQGDAVHHQEFQGVVQHGGVGARTGDDGEHLVHVLLHHGGAHGLLPGQHAVGVAPDGVDLAVVQDQAIGVRPLPAGGGVGGEAGVHHGNGAFKLLLLQIQIEFAQLTHQEHALVHQGAG